MARSKHRKDHRQALASRQLNQRVQRGLAQVDQPVRRGKIKWQIEPEPDCVVLDSLPTIQAMVDGEPVPVAGVSKAGVELVEAPPEGSKVLVGVDYAPLEARVMAHTARNFVLQAQAAGREVLTCPVDTLKRWGISPEAAQLTQNGDMFLVSVDKATADRMREIPRGYTSLGCITDTAPLGRRAGMSEVVPGRGPSRFLSHLDEDQIGLSKAPKQHLELGWHRDAEGKPVFDEISICPGPDPNGLTDIN